MAHTGSCMCGAVSFRVTTPITSAGACHCSMCRKWTGGVFIGVTVPQDGMDIDGHEHLNVYPSSAWAERASCAKCGSSLWYRVTAEGPMQGEYHLGFGTLDDPPDIPMTGEMFIDLKPGTYTFEGGADRHQMATAEIEKMFAEYIG